MDGDVDKPNPSGALDMPALPTGATDIGSKPGFNTGLHRKPPCSDHRHANGSTVGI